MIPILYFLYWQAINFLLMCPYFIIALSTAIKQYCLAIRFQFFFKVSTKMKVVVVFLLLVVFIYPAAQNPTPVKEPNSDEVSIEGNCFVKSCIKIF